jgi:hypothetical protein
MTKFKYIDKDGNGITVEAENKEKSITILEGLGIDPDKLEHL